MKQRVAAQMRRIRDAVGRRGYWLRTIRGRDHWRAGVEILWRDYEDLHERVTISSVIVDDRLMQFLVRNKDDYIQAHHLRGKLYAEDELRRIGAAYRGGTFLDIGANVGNHAIAAARLMNAPKVIAFEPNPEAFRILRCNIALNDLAGVIQHVPFGLSDHDGHARAQSPEHGRNLGGTRLVEGEGDIELRQGDAFCAHEDVGFIKIDVEGAEMAVLGGLKETIARHRPPMLVEVDDRNRAAFDRFCEEFAYQVVERFRVYDGNENFIIRPID